MTRFVLLLLLLLMTACEPQADISYTGSGSVHDPIKPLIKRYEQKNPDIRFTEQGDGSDSFHLNSNSIYGQSREIKAVEKEWGEKFGPLNRKKICYGALTIVVNHDNPVNGLTIGQLKYIYIGKIKNWQEVGGKNALIRVLGRGIGQDTGLL